MQSGRVLEQGRPAYFLSTKSTREKRPEQILLSLLTCSSPYPTVSVKKPPAASLAGAGFENLDMPRRSHQYAVDAGRSDTLRPTETKRSFRPSIDGMALYL